MRLQRSLLSFVALASMSSALWACGSTGDSSLRCGDNGSAEEMSGVPVCVYEDTILIEEGFECPDSAPFGFQVGSTAVCSSSRDATRDDLRRIANESGLSSGEVRQPIRIVSDEDADAILISESRSAVHVDEPTFVGDFNGDGYDDLATMDARNVEGAWTSNRVAQVIFGGRRLQGELDLEDHAVSLRLPLNPSIAGTEIHAVGDLNGDGFADVGVTIEPVNQTMNAEQMPKHGYIWFGSSSAEPDQTALSGGVWIPMQATDRVQAMHAAGDLDGDGIDDLVTVESVDGEPRLGIRYGSTTEPLTWVSYIRSDSSPLLTLADLDGDGGAELLVSTEANPSEFYVWPSGNARLPVRTSLEDAPEHWILDQISPGRIVVADLNRDGRDDLIHYGNAQQLLVYLASPSVLGLESPTAIALAPDARLENFYVSVPISAPESEGRLAVVMRDPLPTGRQYVSEFELPGALPSALDLGDATQIVRAELRPTQDGPDVGHTLSFADIGDFDGDGHLDIVAAHGMALNPSAGRDYDARIHIHYGR